MMTKRLIFVVLMALAASGCLLLQTKRSSQEQLGYDFILSLKTKDTEVFKQLFTEEYLSQFKQFGIKEVLDKTNSIFVNKYGDFTVEDFQYNYQGTDKKGKIYFFFKGERTGEKPIFWINGKWVFESL